MSSVGGGIGTSLEFPEIAVEAVADVRPALFTKLAANACSGPLAVLTGLTNAALAASAEHYATQAEMCKEIEALAQSLNIAVDVDPDTIIQKGASFGDEFKASLLVDFVRDHLRIACSGPSCL